MFGLPKSVDELRQHRIVFQRGAQIEEGALEHMLKIPNIERIITLRTNASTAHACAIELGIGIGALPTYVSVVGANLIPIDIGLRYPVDIWMTYHPDARSSPRIAVFIDWLRTLFDPKRYPCFGDDFVHPRELTKIEIPELTGKFLNLPIFSFDAKAG